MLKNFNALHSRFAMQASPGDNRRRRIFAFSLPRMNSSNTLTHFAPGSLVVITLANPREKFWGMILRLATEGIGVSGVDLSSFDELGAMVKEGEPFTPSVVFFPMRRIERVEADLPVGELPSLSQRFLSKTGLIPAAVFTPSSPEPLRPSDREALPEHEGKERA